MSSNRQPDYSRYLIIILMLVAGVAFLGLGFLLYQAMTQSPKKPEVSSSVLVSSQESETSTSLLAVSSDSLSPIKIKLSSRHFLNYMERSQLILPIISKK